MTNELKEPPSEPSPPGRGQGEGKPGAGNPVTKGWSPERRARQAILIRQRAPWKKSTGPRSAAGKAASSMNAMRHGFRSAGYRELCAALRLQKRFVARLEFIRKNRGHAIQTYGLFKCDAVHSAATSNGSRLIVSSVTRTTVPDDSFKRKKNRVKFPGDTLADPGCGQGVLDLSAVPGENILLELAAGRTTRLKMRAAIRAASSLSPACPFIAGFRPRHRARTVPSNGPCASLYGSRGRMLFCKFSSFRRKMGIMMMIRPPPLSAPGASL